MSADDLLFAPIKPFVPEAVQPTRKEVLIANSVFHLLTNDIVKFATPELRLQFTALCSGKYRIQIYQDT